MKEKGREQAVGLSQTTSPRKIPQGHWTVQGLSTVRGVFGMCSVIGVHLGEPRLCANTEGKAFKLGVVLPTVSRSLGGLSQKDRK